MSKGIEMVEDRYIRRKGLKGWSSVKLKRGRGERLRMEGKKGGSRINYIVMPL